MAEILTPDDERRIIEAVLLLGMTPPFTVEAARDQYRRLARIYHPDAGRTADAERFKALGEAVRTVEAHAAAFASGGLAWNAGGASGGARASQAAQLLEKLSAAEMTIVQKDSELHRLRLERDFAARQTAERKRRGPSAGVIFTGYVLLLGVVAIMGVLLAAKSQPREATLEAFKVTLDPVTVEGVDAAGDKYSVRLEGGMATVNPTAISSAGNAAFVKNRDSSGTLNAEQMRIHIGLPATTFGVDDTILPDVYRNAFQADMRTYAVLRALSVRAPSRSLQLRGDSEQTNTVVFDQTTQPRAAEVVSGYAQTLNHPGPRPTWWPRTVIESPPDPISKEDPNKPPTLRMIDAIHANMQPPQATPLPTATPLPGFP